MKVVKHKYKAKTTECDDIKFHSKLEANYYKKLKIAQKNGDLLFFLMQTPLIIPGKIKYYADFVEFWSDGTVKFVDCKGYDTPTSKVKRKIVESIYPITIDIISKV